MKKQILICVFLISSFHAFTQFENGHKINILTSLGTGIPIGPSQSDLKEGLVNYYNNFPYYVGSDLSVYFNYLNFNIVPGIYFSQRKYSKWVENEGSVLYKGSTGKFSNIGISFVIMTGINDRSSNSKFLFYPEINFGICKFQNEKRGNLIPFYSDYTEIHDGENYSFQTGIYAYMGTLVNKNIALFVKPGINIIPFKNEFSSQKALIILNTNFGFSLNLIRTKRIY